MTTVDNKKLLNAVGDLRQQVISKIAHKKHFRVSRRARKKIDAGASMNDAITYILAEGKSLWLSPKRSPRQPAAESAPTARRRSGTTGGQDKIEQVTSSAHPPTEFDERPELPPKRRTALLVIAALAFIVIAVASAYWWPWVSANLFPQL